MLILSLILISFLVFVPPCVAFFSTKGLDLSWCKVPKVGLPTLDLVLYLKITPEIAVEHGDYGNPTLGALHQLRSSPFAAENATQ